MIKEISYRKAEIPDSLRVSVLCKQVFIDTYCTDGINTESSDFITKEFSFEKTEEKIKNNQEGIILATHKENLVGIAEIEFEKSCPVKNIVAPELSRLYVLERFCGMGIGYQLLRETEKKILSKGIDDVWLSVLAINKRAVSFYEKHKFKHIGNFLFQMGNTGHENKVLYKKL